MTTSATSLIHPDDETREYLTRGDWELAQKQLDEGEDPGVVTRRLHDWARDALQEAEIDAADYANTVGYYDNCD